MKKFFVSIIFILAIAIPSCAKDGLQVNSVTNSLPNIQVNKTTVQELSDHQIVRPIAKKSVPTTKAFNSKGSGLTNYQYDDTYYKYSKYEKFVKDNIDYSQTGRTKIY